MELDIATRTSNEYFNDGSRLDNFYGNSAPANPDLATNLPRLPTRLHHEQDNPSLMDPGPNQGSAYDRIQAVNITGKHKEVYDHFEANPTDLNRPYQILENNPYVLELDEDGRTIFHMLANKISHLGRSINLWESQRKHWVEGLDKIAAWVLARNPALLGPSAGQGSESEAKALEYCCTKGGYVAYAMLNLLLDSKTQDIMRSKCQGESCRKAIPHPLISYLKDINENENGCCHTYERETKDLHNKLQENLRNAALDRQTKMHCLHHIVSNYCANPQPDAVEKLVVLSGRAIVQEADNYGESVLHLAVKKFQSPNVADFDALVSLTEVIQAIVRIYPSSLYTKNRKRNTAYQELIQYQKAQESSTTDRFRDLRNHILEVFKKAYIGDSNQSHIDKIGYLYPSGKEGKSTVYASDMPSIIFASDILIYALDRAEDLP
ncbi:hypothetical protein N7540_003688 [Penicillium herquei]|nr:hypothetical protein N7540_003688 [Penicillium herquei]